MASNHCKNKYYREQELNDTVIDQILKLDISAVKPKPKQKPNHSKEIAKIDKQISKLIDLYSMDGISMDEVKAKIDKLNADKERLMPEIEPEENKLSPKEAEKLINAKDILLNGTMDEKRKIIFALIKKITLYNDHIDIEWNF